MGVSDYAAIAETTNTSELSRQSPTDWNCPSPATIVLDNELRIRDWNSSAENVLGFSADEARGQGLCLIFKAKDLAQIQKLFQHVPTIGGFDSCVSNCISKSGQSITCECLLAVEIGQQASGFSLTLFDPEIISEADRSPDRVLAALDSLESAWLAY